MPSHSAGSGNTRELLCGAMSAVMYFFMVTLNKQSREIVGLENPVLQLTVSFLTVAVFAGGRNHPVEVCV